MNKQVLAKFVKGAITGGVSAIATALSLGVNPQSLEDIKRIAVILGFAFFSGAVHALSEMLSPTVPATIVSTTVESKTVIEPTE